MRRFSCAGVEIRLRTVGEIVGDDRRLPRAHSTPLRINSVERSPARRSCILIVLSNYRLDGRRSGRGFAGDHRGSPPTTLVGYRVVTGPIDGCPATERTVVHCASQMPHQAIVLAGPGWSGTHGRHKTGHYRIAGSHRPHELLRYPERSGSRSCRWSCPACSSCGNRPGSDCSTTCGRDRIRRA